MTKKTTIRTLLFATVSAWGLAVAASAQSTGAPPPAATAETGRGLLGQTYANLGYSYTDLHGTSVNLQGLRFEYNLPLNTGFDLNLGYNNAWTSHFANTSNKQQSFDANAVAFMPDLSWGRPYLGVGAGWIWVKNAGMRDNSFLYQFETGIEFQVTPEWSLTPAIKYIGASSIHVNNHWNYAVKANYWLTSQWGVNGSLGLDNKRNVTYAAGMSYRF